MAVGWAILVVYGVRLILLTRAVSRALSIPVASLSTALATPCALALIVAVAVWSADRGLQWQGLMEVTRLPLDALAGALALLAGLRTLGPRLLRGDLGELLRTRGPLPSVLTRLLNVRT
ncbi:MAG: hypothetical protein IAE86_21325, partial [Burkholderiaceae bacterium]|nr:hypothetical protein [Burkholderiaceae bacterium]